MSAKLVENLKLIMVKDIIHSFSYSLKMLCFSVMEYNPSQGQEGGGYWPDSLSLWPREVFGIYYIYDQLSNFFHGLHVLFREVCFAAADWCEEDDPRRTG